MADTAPPADAAEVKEDGAAACAAEGAGETRREGSGGNVEGGSMAVEGGEGVGGGGGGGGGDGGEGEEKEQGRGSTWSKGRKRMSGKDWKAYQAERKKNKREKERHKKEDKASGGGGGCGGGGGQNPSGGGGASSSAGQEGGEGGAAGGRMRRKVAILFGYSGTAYSGLQKNPGQKTIEEELEKGLFAAGCIGEGNFGFLQKIQWARAARTDKGVHALGNCVSVRLLLEDDVDPVPPINDKLPDDIRVFEVVRVTKSFNAKSAAWGRRYEYLMPSYAFDGSWGGMGAIEDEGQAGDAWEREEVTEADQTSAVSYRAPGDLLERVDAVLKHFKGTRNYHNFTSGKGPEEKSANRYITRFKAESLTVINGREFVSLRVDGQSFMIHQIRKMVGLATFLVRFGGDAETLFKAAFSKEKINVPTAPSAGLLLDRVLYTHYNEKTPHLKALDFADSETLLADFKRSQVLPEVERKEKEYGDTISWLKEVTRFKRLWGAPSSAVGGGGPPVKALEAGEEGEGEEGEGEEEGGDGGE